MADLSQRPTMTGRRDSSADYRWKGEMLNQEHTPDGKRESRLRRLRGGDRILGELHRGQ